MAAKNSRKVYSEDTYYHIYNRGVEKRIIFIEEQDYAVYLSYLKDYLEPKNQTELAQKLTDPGISYKEKDKILKKLKLNNFHDEITLIAYCLMPNHFHLLLKQRNPQSIDKLMNSLGVRYSMYFNRKYKRVGKLFQDVYKAVVVETNDQLLHLSRYIHQNPFPETKLLFNCTQDQVWRACFKQPSSLPDYLGLRQTKWIDPNQILTFFTQTNPSLSYQSFVFETEDLSFINKLTFEC